MKRLRQIWLWAPLAAMGLLAVLSVVGASLGAERAGVMFNSPPLVVFWFLLAALLVACFFVSRGLLRSPGLLAMHLGSLAILAGAMWGSDTGHRLATKVIGREKIPHGYMVIDEGTANHILVDAKGSPIGELPFDVRLDDFRITYYAAKGPWLLGLGAVPGRGEPEGFVRARFFGWKEGEEAAIGDTPLRVRVLQYLPRARPVLDVEGRIVGARPDEKSDTPAMEALVAWNDRQSRGWIVVPEGEKYGVMSLAPILGTLEGAPDHPELGLYLAEPQGMPKDYFSDLAVIQDGKVVVAKTIEVNDPLHWGGYHFYQADYDKEQEAYTILAVRSDSGLWAVYAGFVLLVAGAFVRFWAERAWAGLGRRGRHGV